LPPGTELHGYRIVGLLGRGGFGITYKAVDKIDQVFALKECFPQQLATRRGADVVATDAGATAFLAECLERFTKEARALTLFTNAGGESGVVRVYTFFELNGTAYIVMEYLDGEPLDQVLARHKTGLPEADLTRILRTLLPALDRVHANHLLHRDIKPANIFLRANGSPVLLDFGAARVNDPGEATTFTSIYTESYAPIEQIRGERQGPYSDIYALGATCYRAIAGKPSAMTGTRVPAREAGAGRYSDRLLAAIDWALQVMPQDRPQTVAAFAASCGLPLTGDADTDVTVVRPAAPVDGTKAAGAHEQAAALQPRQTGNGMAIAAALCGLAVLGGGGFAVWKTQGGRPGPAPPAVATPPQPVVQTPRETPSGDAARAAGDTTGAIARYTVAAGHGDTHAMFQLGTIFLGGHGVPADRAQALDWFKRAAEAGHAPSQSQLGFMYLTGVAGAPDPSSARTWFEKAAAQNYPQALFELGYMAQHPAAGAARNLVAMLDYYRRAADLGLPEAQQQLGYCYQVGLGLAHPDVQQSIVWYGKAADQGLAKAMYSLGQIYESGDGAPAQPDLGRNWMVRAAGAGSVEAKRWLASH
jgi:predicted Ser/Thr protein kinase